MTFPRSLVCDAHTTAQHGLRSRLGTSLRWCTNEMSSRQGETFPVGIS